MFLFGTENWEEQLKKALCIILCLFRLIRQSKKNPKSSDLKSPFCLLLNGDSNDFCKKLCCLVYLVINETLTKI